MMTVEHGFSLEYGFIKILPTLNFPLLYLTTIIPLKKQGSRISENITILLLNQSLGHNSLYGREMYKHKNNLVCGLQFLVLTGRYGTTLLNKCYIQIYLKCRYDGLLRYRNKTLVVRLLGLLRLQF